MSRTGAEIRERALPNKEQNTTHEWSKYETQSKFVQDRIASVEKHFGQLCDTMSSYTRKTARIRDKGDQLCKDLLATVEGETINPSAVRNLSDLAHNISSIQDYRQAQVTRLDTKVVQPLSNYGLKCKHAKADLKAAFAARDKEQKLRKKLELARSKGDQRQIIQIETELQKASVDASRTSKNLEQQTDKFELEKLQDIKKILTDFVNIEMVFHAKALELYTQCFQNVQDLSIDEDIQEFRAKVRPTNSANRMNMARHASEGSLNSYENTPRADLAPAYSSTQSSPTRRPQPAPTQNGVQGPLDDDDEDEDDEDDEEEEEESEEDDDDEEEETEAETDRSPQTRVVQVRR